MEKRLAAAGAYPPLGPSEFQLISLSVAGHVDHCFSQLYRCSDLAEKGGEFRAMQFGLNLGRAQELLGSLGGPDAWWRPFEALVNAKNWAAVKAKVVAYCDALGRPGPLRV